MVDHGDDDDEDDEDDEDDDDDDNEDDDDDDDDVDQNMFGVTKPFRYSSTFSLRHAKRRKTSKRRQFVNDSSLRLTSEGPGGFPFKTYCWWKKSWSSWGW